MAMLKSAPAQRPKSTSTIGKFSEKDKWCFGGPSLARCNGFILLSVFILFFVVACGGVKSAPTEEVKTAKTTSRPSITLRSGRQVVLVASGPLMFGDGSQALMVKYETASTFADVPALRQEAQDLWLILRPDIERQGHANVILSANSPSTGALIEQTSSYNFLVRRDTAGVWTLE